MREWIRRVVQKLKDDDILTQSAGIAYYLVFSIFPLALLFVTLLAFVPVKNLDAHLLDLIGRALPPDVVDVVRDHVLQLVQTRRSGLFTLGTILTVWSASAATRATIRSLNRTFGVKETRPWWANQLRAIGLTLGLALLLVVALALLAFGPAIGTKIARSIGLGRHFGVAWVTLRWPLVFVVASAGSSLLYYFGPNVDHDFRWLTLGGLFSTVAWVAASFGLTAYVREAHFDSTYGVLGGFMLLLLWFYLTGLGFLLGGVLNAMIQEARAQERPETGCFEAGPPINSMA